LRKHGAAGDSLSVTAGQIATSGDIEVMNPNLVLCHLDEGATLNMEFAVEAGKGPPAACPAELRGRQSPGLPLVRSASPPPPTARPTRRSA
jgi:hypothetical protein